MVIKLTYKSIIKFSRRNDRRKAIIIVQNSWFQMLELIIILGFLVDSFLTHHFPVVINLSLGSFEIISQIWETKILLYINFDL